MGTSGPRARRSGPEVVTLNRTIPSLSAPSTARRWSFLTVAGFLTMTAVLTMAGILTAGSPLTEAAPSSPAGVVDTLGRQVQAAREALYRGEEDLDGILQRLDQLVRDLEAAEAQASKAGSTNEAATASYWQSVALLELATLTEATTGPGAQAYQLFEQAERAAARAAQLAPSRSEPRRVLGEVSMRLIPYRGPSSAVFLASRAFKELDMALRLDPKNPWALIAMAQYYWGSPPEFSDGGPRRGLMFVEEALRVASSDLERYVAYVWQGNLYRKLGDEPKAQDAFAKALAIFPRGGMARFFQQQGEGDAR